jgi:hypothetical protein
VLVCHGSTPEGILHRLMKSGWHSRDRGDGGIKIHPVRTTKHTPSMRSAGGRRCSRSSVTQSGGRGTVAGRGRAGCRDSVVEEFSAAAEKRGAADDSPTTAGGEVRDAAGTAASVEMAVVVVF